ncbi:hypothetical protein E2C01_030753 [Portunus trituberculatus]|uniref:Uncharacterized protein n=1 Tax=Portunus trituberculatus TaxID=210409 RepID=A0A5B7EW75_PORTR|nr:hypothetical protein [Portunus trituberculatus]
MFARGSARRLAQSDRQPSTTRTSIRAHCTEHPGAVSCLQGTLGPAKRWRGRRPEPSAGLIVNSMLGLFLPRAKKECLV